MRSDWRPVAHGGHVDERLPGQKSYDPHFGCRMLPTSRATPPSTKTGGRSSPLTLRFTATLGSLCSEIPYSTALSVCTLLPSHCHGESDIHGSAQWL